jgi:hypothetical protein
MLGRKDKLAIHLVRPSGSLDSPLAHRLNQPSFTTEHPEGGETADYTNGCVAMLMGNAYEPGRTLLFDHVHRRDHTSEAIAEYNPQVLQVHEDFTNRIAEASLAKVEIIYGAKVQRRLIQTQQFEVLPLWGEFDGVVLLLAYETNYRNKDAKFLFRRVMPLAYHPQHLFYQSRNGSLAARQDMTMKAATLMVGKAVPWIENYFGAKFWMQQVPSPLQLAEIRAFGKIVQKEQRIPPATILQQDDVSTGDPSLTDEGSWHPYFYEKPHSNDVLRQLVPLALEALSDGQSFTDVKRPTDLPFALLEWFKGQKQILFSDRKISSFQDVISSIDQMIGKRMPQSSSQTLKGKLAEILAIQQQSLKTVPGKHQQYYHSRFGGLRVELSCRVCQNAVQADLNPRWAVHKPGVYIVPARRCPCGYRGTDLRPTAGNKVISCTTSAPDKVFQSPYQWILFDDKPYICPPMPVSKTYPGSIETWCIRCKDSNQVVTDTEPKWLLTTPPRYLERKRKCARCSQGTRKDVAVRFVPVIPSIDSTYHNALKAFHIRYALLDLETRLMLLNRTPLTSTESRARKGR